MSNDLFKWAFAEPRPAGKDNPNRFYGAENFRLWQKMHKYDLQKDTSSAEQFDPEDPGAAPPMAKGLGRVGSGVARIGNAFGMNLIAWSQNMTPEAAKAAGAILVSKDELFEQADILTIHLVLSSRSRCLVGAAELEKMKPTSWLISASRGPFADEQALISALQSKQIAGAAIDVFDIEPMPHSHPFRMLDSVRAG